MYRIAAFVMMLNRSKKNSFCGGVRIHESDGTESILIE